jgi:CRP-like cAMP-binding protein
MNPLQLLIQKITVAGLWEREILLKRGEILKSRGTVDTRIFYVHEGSLRAYLWDGQGEHTIRFGYPGNMMAALDSFFSGQPSPMIIQALRSTKLSIMGKTAFMQFIQNDEENRVLWQIILETLIVQQLERETDLLTASPAERYQRVLQRSPQLFQEIPHRFIAAYLRMTPETLSRLKKS